LIVEEAGGKVTDFSGSEFQIASRETLASNVLVHDALMQEFREILAGRGWKSCRVRLPTRRIEDSKGEPGVPPGRPTARGRRDARRSTVSVQSGTITYVISSLLDRKIEKRPDKVRLQGRILFLTEDPELIKKQLAGWDLPWDTENPANNPKLRDDISTDEITPRALLFLF